MNHIHSCHPGLLGDCLTRTLRNKICILCESSLHLVSVCICGCVYFPVQCLSVNSSGGIVLKMRLYVQIHSLICLFNMKLQPQPVSTKTKERRKQFLSAGVFLFLFSTTVS